MRLLIAALGLSLLAPSGRVSPVKLPAALTTLGQEVRVDWQAGLVLADGRGLSTNGYGEATAKLFARAAAIADAQRLAAWTGERLQASSSEELAKCELSPSEETKVKAVLRGARVLPESERYEWRADGQVLASVTVTAPIYGAPGAPALVQPELTAACRDEPLTDGGKQ